MNKSDIIISAIASAGESVEGRTTIQKWCYFASIRTGIDLGYAPHYYGPYSQLVSLSIDDLVASEFLIEKGRQTIHGRVMYEYILTDDGKSIAKELKRTNPELYGKIAKIVETCINVVGNNIRVLSWAAKVYWIVRSRGKEVTYSEIEKIGETLGWQISKKEIDSGVKLLSALSLAKKT